MKRVYQALRASKNARGFLKHFAQECERGLASDQHRCIQSAKYEFYALFGILTDVTMVHLRSRNSVKSKANALQIDRGVSHARMYF